MAGTDIAVVWLPGSENPRRMLAGVHEEWVLSAILLRVCYAMSGTDIGHPYYAMSGTPIQYAASGAAGSLGDV
eukprot:1778704-Rhodomonas_salina.5